MRDLSPCPYSRDQLSQVAREPDRDGRIASGTVRPGGQGGGLARAIDRDAMMITGDMRVAITDSPERESTYAEITCGGEEWAIVSDEQGPLILEVYARESGGVGS